MLVTLKGLLEDAKNKKQAVGAFNGTTLEGIRAIIGAAEEFQRPVILQHAQSHDTIIDLNEIAPLMLHYARSASVPVAVHLDHGSTFKRCMEAIRAGFTSVMYDASAKPFEQNLMETAEIVKAATVWEYLWKQNLGMWQISMRIPGRTTFIRILLWLRSL